MKLTPLAISCALALGLSLTGCNSTQIINDVPTQTVNQNINIVKRANSASLTADYAAFRRQQIQNVDYQLQLALDKKGDNFLGVTTINLTLNDTFGEPITVDFELGTINSLTVNGKKADYSFDKWFISIAPQAFKPGKNTIQISYQRPYSTDGSGLHRFVDPVDNKVYLYSDFEPYDANRLFPHFDQPDLKAQFSSTVTAPSDWQIVSTTRETSIEHKGEFNTWYFPPSKKISSYVFAMHAGPYHMWQDEYNGMPLRLFSRESIAQYVKPQDWFTPTKQSFGFFNSYFDYNYPFDKYDQLMAPDYNSGAMENVAAVTFNEAYVSRGEKSIAQKRSLANTIAHEMAHMWFGDLVTMRWWNGLWLNESFATYMANLALSKASDFDNIWNNFYSGTKQWAYFADGSVNTHPIELPVKDTTEAFSNFDGITYGKGASVLKQIPYYLGEQNFQQGVQNYLKKFAYSNTSLDDFIGELGKAANKDLTQWTQQWLYQAGTNTIKANYQCNNGKITKFSLIQTAPKEYPVLREQRVQVGLYQIQGNKIVAFNKIPVTYQGAETKVIEAQRKSCPDLVYPNADDWGFVKVDLDQKSVATLNKHINGITDSTLRLMLWQSLYDSVYDAKLAITDYIDFALANIAQEQDITIIRKVASHLGRSISFLNIAKTKGVDLSAYKTRIEQFTYQQLVAANAGSEVQKIWFGRYLDAANSVEHLQKLHDLLSGKWQLPGLKIDQDKRWAIIKNLSYSQFGDYKTLIEKESAKDPSDSGKIKAIVCQVVQPELANKEHWFEVVVNNPNHYKLAWLGNIIYALFDTQHPEFKQALSQRILNQIPKLNEQGNLGLLRAFASLNPATNDEQGIALLTQAVTTFKDMKPQVVKAYKQHLQNTERMVAIIKKQKQQLANTAKN